MAPSLEEIGIWSTKYPCPYLWAHIFQKGYQGGAFLGTTIAIPAVAAWQVLKEKKEKPDVLQLAQGAAFTTLAALGLTCERLRDELLHSTASHANAVIL